MKGQWKYKIFNAGNEDFQSIALEIFRFQYENNSVYRQFNEALRTEPGRVNDLRQIPFLPIRFFKSHIIQSAQFQPELIFESSGTTTTINSRHFVKEAELYKESFSNAFRLFYGSPADWCVIGLLPSYLQRGNSSLVYMVNELIQQSAHPQSGFYLDEFEKLNKVLEQLEKQKQKTLLIGVTFALLDFAEHYTRSGHDPLQHTIIMETGGMKGRRKEMLRPEVHNILKQAFGLPVIHSEYGMTELLSQAYSKGEGIFHSPPWMRMLVREEEDPLQVKDSTNGQAISGALNIIDLANIDSCSFIATDDAARIYPDNSFEVMGRLDNSDLRGCSLLSV